MYPRILVVLLAAALICTAAACGGGEQGDQSQGSGSDQANGEGGKKDKMKGNVARTVPDRDIFVVRAPGEGPMVFRYRTETVEVKLDGEKVDPDAIKSGQSVTVEYLTRTTPKDKEVNVARSVELQTADDGGSGEETTS